MDISSLLSRQRLRDIMRIALPAIVSNVSVPLLSLVDTAITGHLGAAAYIGAIAVGGMIFSVLYWLMGFLRMGTSGLTSQAYGRGDMHDASLQLSRAMMLGVGIGLLLVVARVPVGRLAFALAGCPESVRPLSETYFSICIFGAPAVLAMYAYSGWFIGMQNSRIPMSVAIFQNLVNIAASLLLVYGAGMKVEGVAAGTVMGEYAGLAAFALLRRRAFPSLPRVALREVARRSSLARFFGINRDIFLRTVCLVAVMSYFTVAGGHMGELTLAANALLMQLYLIFSYVSDGFAYASEALSGKLIGGRDERGFRAMVGACTLLAAAVAVVFTLAYAAGGWSFLSLLTNDAPTVGEALRFLPYAAMIPVVSVAAFVLDGVFVGATASRFMLVAAALAAAVFFSTFFALLPHLGNHALWTAFLIYMLVRSAAMAALYPKMRRRAFRQTD